jgi:hypothetical protein
MVVRALISPQGYVSGVSLDFRDFEKLPNTLRFFTIVYAESVQEILSGIQNLLPSKKDLFNLV